MDLMHRLGSSIEKQLWRNKQNDRPISDSEIKAVLSQLFKGSILVPPVGGHVIFPVQHCGKSDVSQPNRGYENRPAGLTTGCRRQVTCRRM
ncbi:hypothetical protein AVEN_7266-1 [Araneus ventricosus]|uniref:Uncharacterized protein n=1 Tax=Araneus ventricosus TaxID=182803 RepID=A0A4Y2RRM1_ARAVE|nr:hypothetical protein AVEN_7266-1 [Araneus ventricosus]